MKIFLFYNLRYPFELPFPTVGTSIAAGDPFWNFFEIKNGFPLDDTSVAPGPGMLFRADVVANTIIDVKKEDTDAYIIHMSPRGIPLNSKKAKELSQKNILLFWLLAMKVLINELLITMWMKRFL